MRRIALLSVLLLAGCAAPAVEPVGPACVALDLELQLREESSAFDLVATNTADEPCSLTGYPRVQVLSQDGSVIAEAAVKTDLPPPVDLGPGDAAYALIEFVRGEVLCDSSDTGGISITLPGSTATTVLGEGIILFCPGGDEVRAGSFRSEPLEGHELQPQPDQGY